MSTTVSPAAVTSGSAELSVSNAKTDVGSTDRTIASVTTRASSLFIPKTPFVVLLRSAHEQNFPPKAGHVRQDSTLSAEADPAPSRSAGKEEPVTPSSQFKAIIQYLIMCVNKMLAVSVVLLQENKMRAAQRSKASESIVERCDFSGSSGKCCSLTGDGQSIEYLNRSPRPFWLFVGLRIP